MIFKEGKNKIYHSGHTLSTADIQSITSYVKSPILDSILNRRFEQGEEGELEIIASTQAGANADKYHSRRLLNYEIRRRIRKEFARKIDSEVRAYMDSLNYGEKPIVPLKTNAEYAREYAELIARYGGKPKLSKNCISRIIREYLPRPLIRFREKELKFYSHIPIKLKTPEENIKNGRKGAEITNLLKRRTKHK